MKLKQCIVLVWFSVVTICSGIPVLSQTTVSDLLVSSRNTNSIKRYDGETGAFVGDFVSPNAGGLNAPQEVLFGADGNLLVTGRGNRNILKYDGQSGAFLGNFSSGYLLDEPTKMTLGPDSLLYISQWGQQQSKVARFDFVTGAFVDEFTAIGLNQACGHAWDADSNLYVASFGSADVRKFDPQGNFLSVFAKGPLQGAVNLWFAADGGELFVADWTQGAVLRFDGQTGSFIANFITGLQNLEGFAFGPDSLIYLCDWTANQVKRYDATGSFVDIFASDGNMRAPNSVIFFPGEGPTSVGRTDESVPDRFALEQNYPNPFNPSTTIRYHIAEPAQIALEIVNLQGEVIALLVRSRQAAGQHSAIWDGRDRHGRLVASGVYFSRLRVREFATARRMVFLQ